MPAPRVIFLGRDQSAEYGRIRQDLMYAKVFYWCAPCAVCSLKFHHMLLMRAGCFTSVKTLPGDWRSPIYMFVKLKKYGNKSEVQVPFGILFCAVSLTDVKKR